MLWKGWIFVNKNREGSGIKKIAIDIGMNPLCTREEKCHRFKWYFRLD